MRALIGKPMNLVFNRGAIARPDPFDHAGKHRRAVEPTSDNGVGSFIRVGNPARPLLWVLLRVTQEGKHGYRLDITVLALTPGKVDAPGVKTWRRPGFQAPSRQLHRCQPLRQLQ